MRQNYTKRKIPVSHILSKKYKSLDQNQINELIQNIKNLFNIEMEFESDFSEKYKIFQSAIALILENKDPPT